MVHNTGLKGQGRASSLGTSITLTMFDHKLNYRHRAWQALKQRGLLKFQVRLMTFPATQWNAFYEELWQPEFMTYLRPQSRIGSLYADQRALLEK